MVDERGIIWDGGRSVGFWGPMGDPRPPEAEKSVATNTACPLSHRALRRRP